MFTELKLEQILKFLEYHSYKKISYRDYHIIEYGSGYEIASINAFLNFKQLYLDLYDCDLLYISLRDFIAMNSELKKIINKYKLGFFSRQLAKTHFFRREIFDTRGLFNDKEFYKFFEEKGAYLDLDIHVMTRSNFIYSLFHSISNELGEGSENKDEVGKELYDEINKTLLSKKSYSGEIELTYILKDFIFGNNKYVYFLLEDLEHSKNLKVKNIIIFEGRIKFIISDLTEIERKLFTNIEEKQKEDIREKKFYSTYIDDKFKIGVIEIDGKLSSKPGELIKLFYKLKKNGEYKVDFNDMRNHILSNPSDFNKLNISHFTESVIREILRKKNTQISIINELKPILKGEFFISTSKSLFIQK